MDPSLGPRPRSLVNGRLLSAAGMAPLQGHRRRDGAPARPPQKISIAAVITDGTPSP